MTFFMTRESSRVFHVGFDRVSAQTQIFTGVEEGGACLILLCGAGVVTLEELFSVVKSLSTLSRRGGDKVAATSTVCFLSFKTFNMAKVALSRSCFSFAVALSMSW